MKPETLLEVLDAGMLAKYVDTEFHQMGGIMLVKPPGNMGSTFIKRAAELHPESALLLSDLTLPSFKVMRDDFTSGRFSTLCFLELEKLYSRQMSTAMNLEGLIKSLVEEGFRHFATEDQRMPSLEARAHVQAALTLSMFRHHYERWNENGFTRRFLWVVFRLNNEAQIAEAIHKWQLIDMGNIGTKTPVNGKIRYALSPEDSEYIHSMIKEQPGQNGTAFTLLKKIACVLRWKYPPRNGTDKAMEILKDFKKSLSRKGDELII